MKQLVYFLMVGLAFTALQVSTVEAQEEYPDMGGKQYTSANMADVLGYGDMASPELKRDQVAAQTLAEKGVTPDQVGDGVVKALTRDYSDLMKVINKDK